MWQRPIKFIGVQMPACSPTTVPNQRCPQCDASWKPHCINNGSRLSALWPTRHPPPPPPATRTRATARHTNRCWTTRLPSDHGTRPDNWLSAKCLLCVCVVTKRRGRTACACQQRPFDDSQWCARCQGKAQWWFTKFNRRGSTKPRAHFSRSKRQCSTAGLPKRTHASMHPAPKARRRNPAGHEQRGKLCQAAERPGQGPSEFVPVHSPVVSAQATPARRGHHVLVAQGRKSSPGHPASKLRQNGEKGAKWVDCNAQTWIHRRQLPSPPLLPPSHNW